MDKKTAGAIEVLKNIIKANETHKKMKCVFEDEKSLCDDRILALQLAIKSLQDDWVSVEDRLPDLDEEYYNHNDEHKTYLVMLEHGTIPTTMHCDGETWLEMNSEGIDFCETEYKVTHWQPLPNHQKG